MPVAMPNASHLQRVRAAFAWAIVALLISFGAEAASPKRVLVLHSFGRDFAPYDTITAVFRTELARRATDPITFVEANLDSGRLTNERERHAFLEYLGAKFADKPPDVVVTIGPPAARFYLQHRAALFPATPLVLGALDERFVRQVALQPSDAVVAGKLDLPGLVDNILNLLPQTETIAVVVGASELERFWASEFKRELAPFAGRVKFEWLDKLSLDDMQKRVAVLPPHSAVLYGLLIVDAAGVPHERQIGLEKLHAASNAPIFGLYENEIGKGVVGGPYSSQSLRGKQLASATLLAISGPAGSQSRIDVIGLERPVYDWRELARWDIDQSRLPAGSEVRFEPPSLWQEHRLAIVLTSAALLLQALLITSLLLQRGRRRRAEHEAQGLAGRLVTAHEDERRRIARELHDDVTQRVAGLAIAAAELESHTPGTEERKAAHDIRTGLVSLGEDVHALSYRLHPSVIEDLGLVEALRVECERIAQYGRLQVNFDCGEIPRNLTSDSALCLFRVAQEALRNVERHAKADRVDVAVGTREGGVSLEVRDNGAGFDAGGIRQRASLGLASMRERVRLLGGRLDIDSGIGVGTSLKAWIPLRAAA
jgi:signal transduction histidine kinase